MSQSKLEEPVDNLETNSTLEESVVLGFEMLMLQFCVHFGAEIGRLLFPVLDVGWTCMDSHLKRR